jgi:membrane protease subunit HflK
LSEIIRIDKDPPPGRDKNARFVMLLTQIGVVAVVLVVLILSAFYTVSEQERVVVTQFGRQVKVEEAGLRFKIPFVQNIHRVNMTTREMYVGYNPLTQALIEAESLMITSDFNFINCDFFIEWRVIDPVKFLYSSRDPIELLRSAIQAEARSIVSSLEVDDALTSAKSEIQQRVREGASLKMEEYNLGIHIVNVSALDFEPPTEDVKIAFKDVQSAEQDKEMEIYGARKYENELIPAALALADREIQAAEGIRAARVNEANGQVARFNEIFTEYSRNKDITRTRMYLEAMEVILPGVRLIVTDPSDSGILKMLDLNPQSEGGGEND